MSDSRSPELARVDLNLLRVFDAIMLHRSVAAAGRELGVTASAVSHALARLRRLLGDELFVPGGDGMMPTARALELAPNIRDGLSTIVRALNTRPFHPAETVRTFSIAVSDYVAVILLPELLRRFSARAPQANLRVSPIGRIDIAQQLEDGRIDLIIGWFDTLPNRVQRQALLEEQEAMVVRAGHPLTQQPVTKRKLFAFPHLVVEFTGTEDHGNDGFTDDRGIHRRTWIDRLLIETGGKGRGLVGRVAVTVPTYSIVAPALAVTDMVATLPRRLAQMAVVRDGLVMLDLPYPPLSVAVEMVWHDRGDGDPGLTWLLQQVAAAAEVARDA